jgi:hypothetical protein
MHRERVTRSATIAIRSKSELIFEKNITAESGLRALRIMVATEISTEKWKFPICLIGNNIRIAL